MGVRTSSHIMATTLRDILVNTNCTFIVGFPTAHYVELLLFMDMHWSSVQQEQGTLCVRYFQYKTNVSEQ